MAKILLLILIAFSASAHAVWLPKRQSAQGIYFEYEPLCNDKRQQVQVRLLDSTNFLMATDVKANTLLFGIRFTYTGTSRSVKGILYCEPYETKKLTFFDGHTANKENERKTASGISQCLVDSDEDGFFDDSSTGYFAKPNPSDRHKYKYEVIPADGPPDAGCPRQKLIAPALEVNGHIWSALSDAERTMLTALGEVEVIPAQEVGVITHSQKLDGSSPGSNAGSALGESFATANYIDKSISNGSYSATGRLGAQIIGALLGSALDSGPRSSFTVRYTVRLASGELVTVDKTTSTNNFSLTNGMCVTLPKAEQTKQALCETTLTAFREVHFKKSEPVMPLQNSKEIRLRELKRLFDEGLLSEPVYRDQQHKILSN